MRSLTSLLVVMGMVCGGVQPARAESGADFFKRLIKRADALYRAKASTARMTMEIKTPHWSRTMKMDVWSEGMDKTFIRIRSPKKEAGISTLRMDKEMWNYFPKIGRVIKVPPSMMMSSWMGSDFTNDDLVKESSLLDDYRIEDESSRDPSAKYYKIVLTPREQAATVWGKIVIRMTKTKGNEVPVQQDYYDEKGKLKRTIKFSEPVMVSGRKVPTLMVLEPVDKEGNMTRIKYDDLKFLNKAPAGIFTLRNLQKNR